MCAAWGASERGGSADARKAPHQSPTGQRAARRRHPICAGAPYKKPAHGGCAGEATGRGPGAVGEWGATAAFLIICPEPRADFQIARVRATASHKPHIKLRAGGWGGRAAPYLDTLVISLMRLYHQKYTFFRVKKPLFEISPCILQTKKLRAIMELLHITS